VVRFKTPSEPSSWARAARDDQVLENDVCAGFDDLKGPVLELTGVNDRRGPGPLDDPAMAGTGEIQIPGKPGRFVIAAGVLDGQRIGAGQQLDGVVLAARIGIELEDGVAEAAAAEAAVGERRRDNGRRDPATLKGFEQQLPPGTLLVPAGAGPRERGETDHLRPPRLAP
jgi:hypothetical protein